MNRSVNCLMVGCAITFASCGESAGPDPATPVSFAVSGDSQMRFPGSRLPENLRVRLLDAGGTGTATSGLPVTWTITAGGGTLGRESDTTDHSGIARTSWRLGSAEGIQYVRVTVAAFEPYEFTAEAVHPGPIAFVSNRRTGDPGIGMRLKPSDVFVMDEDGGSVVQYSPNFETVEWLSEPSWSPDGLQLAYLSSPQGTASGQVFVAQADSEDDDAIGSWTYASFTWSPDARHMVASSQTSPGLWLINTGGGTNRTWVRWQDHSHSASDSRNPDWSPDGSKIVFECGPIGVGSICIMAEDASGLLQVTDGPTDTDPAWSPDGTRILFARDTLNAGGVWVMNENGSGLERVLEGRATNPRWSPDGTEFVVAVVHDSGSDIWRVNLSTGESINLTNGEGYNWDPDWRW